MSGETVRLFVAVDLPEAGRDAVQREIDALGRIGADVRWVRAAQLHVTLKFVGDTAAGEVDALQDGLRAVPRPPALRLAVRGLGRFPPAGKGAPRVFWAGLSGDVDALEALARGVEDACADCGVPRERRPFAPHLTIGRVKGSRNLRDLEAAVETRGPKLEVELPPVGGFRLYRSELQPTGAVHTVIEEYPFS